MIKTGFLVSYDYEFLKIALPFVYKASDLIVLCIDQDRMSWSGNVFNFDETIFEWVKSIDSSNKIKIYQDKFYSPDRSSIENDSFQRTKLAEFMGEGGWHIQLDTDEYFPGFEEFTRFLKSKKRYLNHPVSRPIDIGAFLVPIIKTCKEGYIYVKNSKESFVLATNYPEYTNARRSKHRIIFSDHYVFHQSLARSEEEIKFKILNWGHNKDFNTLSYFKLWQVLDEHNVKFIKDFNPVYGDTWHELDYIKAGDMTGFINAYMASNKMKLPKSFVLYKNLAQILLQYKK